MRLRQDTVEIFSSFIQFDFDRFSSWVSDPRLRRSINSCLAKEEQITHSENFWVIYWHKRWAKETSGIARDHLIAYLQEACFWSSKKTVSNFQSTQYSIPDGFQIAITGIDKVLKGFNRERGFSLKSYASITFSNLIREILRQRQEVDICSEWSLLRKLSKKRLTESLQNAGLATDVVEKYVLAWFCFNSIYVPERASPTKKLSKPDAATWEAIANLYNQESKSQLSSANEIVNAITLEKWLLASVKAARGYLYPNVTSINQPKPGYDSGEIADSLVGEVDESLLTEMIVEEETQQRNQQQSQVNAALLTALNGLKPEERHLLDLYYVQELKQSEIAQQLNTQQYSISRKLSRIKKSLLKSFAQWSKDNLHISLTSDVLKDISTIIEEWLTSHYQNQSES